MCSMITVAQNFDHLTPIEGWNFFVTSTTVNWDEVAQKWTFWKRRSLL